MTIRNASIIAPEVIEQHGDIQDYRVNVGTGPFQLVDWVEDSTMTWERVDDYWGFDEKFPENRLPYIDSVQGVLMKEPATHMAAVRSRKIDSLSNNGTAQIVSMDDIDNLQASNPELQYYERLVPLPKRVVGLAVTMEPFNDIRVRHAMQMALDLETMNNDYFNGRADWKPEGMIGVYSRERITRRSRSGRPSCRATTAMTRRAPSGCWTRRAIHAAPTASASPSPSTHRPGRDLGLHRASRWRTGATSASRWRSITMDGAAFGAFTHAVARRRG